MRQLPVRAVAQPVQSRQEFRRVVGRQRRSRRRRHAAAGRGTDGGGSIRIPASWCGVYGYKQSFGRVPFVARPNAFAGTAPFLFEGPITRTVEDAALALTALAGYDSRDPHSLDEQVDFTAATRRSIRGWKIAYSPTFDVFPMDRRVTDVVGGAVKAFEEAGAHVEEIKVGIERPQKD